MENRAKNKWIVEASFMAAITFILIMLTATPMFDIIGSFIVPIPITVLYLRHGKKAAWLSVIVAGVLGALFYTPLIILNVAIVYGPIGVVLGYCIKKEKTAVKTIVALGLVNCVGNIVNYIIIFTGLTGMNLTEYLQGIVDIFHQAANMSAGMAQASAVTQQIVEFYKSINVEFILMILPIGFIMGIILSSFLNFIIARGILRRLGFKVKSLPPFSTWYLDNRISGILIILFCLSYIMKVNNVLYSGTFFITMVYLLMFIFMIQSLSVIAYFLKNKLKLSNALVFFTEIIIIISPVSLYILAIGIGDLIMDIRGVDPNSLKNFIKGKINK